MPGRDRPDPNGMPQGGPNFSWAIVVLALGFIAYVVLVAMGVLPNPLGGMPPVPPA